jgi:predicted nuclease of predicted toxin-antitoxin system
VSISIVIDMNLPPAWAQLLSDAGCPAVHWSQIGDMRASDAEIMAWARANNHVVFTHDLDFGTTLALTHANGPSVIQVRARNVLSSQLIHVVQTVVQQYAAELELGALVVIELSKLRVRILPL